MTFFLLILFIAFFCSLAGKRFNTPLFKAMVLILIGMMFLKSGLSSLWETWQLAHYQQEGFDYSTVKWIRILLGILFIVWGLTSYQKTKVSTPPPLSPSPDNAEEKSQHTYETQVEENSNTAPIIEGKAILRAQADHKKQKRHWRHFFKRYSQYYPHYILLIVIILMVFGPDIIFWIMNSEKFF